MHIRFSKHDLKPVFLSICVMLGTSSRHTCDWLDTVIPQVGGPVLAQVQVTFPSILPPIRRIREPISN